MKKGFTLIEVISVIIVMAIIALIATPIVLSVIDKAEEESRKNSVRGYADSVRLSYAEEILKNTGKPLKELATLKTQGQEVDCEYVKYDDKKFGTLLHSCKVDAKGNYCYINGYVFEDGTVECNNIINLIMSDGIPYNTPNIYVVTQIPDGLEYAQSKEISVEYPSLKVIEEKYFIKSSETLEINAIGKCGTEELPGKCIEENVATIEANTWYQVNGNMSFTVNKNLTIEAIIGNNNEYGSKKTYEVNNIDTTEPSISIEGTSTTSNKIIVSAKCEDLESNISKYEYTIDGTNYQESNVFNNLSSINKYKVKVRCTNGSGMSKEIESEEISLNEIIKPTIEQVSQTPSDSEWAQKRIIRITYNGTGIDNPKYYYSLDNETWIEVSETTKDIEFTSNGNLYAKTVDETGNTANAATFTVTNIDTSAPNIPTITYNGGANTCTWKNNYNIVLSSSDNIGVAYYQVDWDGDGVSNYDVSSNFVPWSGYYSHNNRFRAVDHAGNVSGWSEVHHIHMDTEIPTTPTVTFNSGANSHSWKNNYNMTFKSTDNVGIAKFQVDNNQDGKVDREFTASSNAYTFIPESGYSTCTDRYRSVDHAGNVSAWTGVYHIHQDTTLPTVTVSVSGKTATFTIKDNISAIGYGVNQSSTSQPSYTTISGTTSTSKSWTASAAGTYYVWVKDQAGNVNKTSFSVASSAFFTSKDFAYTGGIQTFTVPATGTYKLEVWGAQGGIDGQYDTQRGYGGKGGYSYGNISLTSGQVIYIVVGGQGVTSEYFGTAAGGYNGGGSSKCRAWNGYTHMGGSGGGATHMATKTGLLSTLSSSTGNILIVAGGGGGGSSEASDGYETPYNGGAGGGTSGEAGQIHYGGYGGTQTSGGNNLQITSTPSSLTCLGSFGQGGHSEPGGGGGGGYYGGGGAYGNYAGGGGSGYIGGVTGGSMQTGVREGHGYARITLVTISN